MKSGLVRGTAPLAVPLAFLVTAALAGAPEPPPPATIPTGASPAASTPGVAKSGESEAGQSKQGVAKPDAAKPDVATLLFDTSQWGDAPPGSKIRYEFEKTTADPAFGPGFKDEVVLTLEAGDDAQSRATEMQLFSGANRKPAGPFRSDKQNPVLLVVLENNVQEMSKLFQANPRYLKNAIRKAWRDNPTITTATDTIDGKPLSVTRIAVSPFVGDLEADRMKGLSSLTYTVDVSHDVPGSIAAIDIRAEDGGKVRFSETLRYMSEARP